MDVPLSQLGSLLFTMMGPIGLIPLFAATTANADPALRTKIAGRALFFALLALAIAVFVGAGVMQSVGTTQSALIMAAGGILLLTSLRNIFGMAPPPAAPPAEPTTALALAPIAIPGIVTPMGVAILIIFASYFPDLNDRTSMFGVVAGIMVANYGAMRGAHWFMRVVGPTPLIVLGAIFGVLQAAMGVEMIVSGLGMSRLFGHS
ncbi:MAG: MarC family protein [Methylobacterium sp.]|nr:MarC family protein [Methylobacterium sp.]